jgi:hypothetical protein
VLDTSIHSHGQPLWFRLHIANFRHRHLAFRLQLFCHLLFDYGVGDYVGLRVSGGNPFVNFGSAVKVQYLLNVWIA